MDLKSKIEKFNQRWKIEPKDEENGFQKFKTRVLNFLGDIDSHVSSQSISLFCQFYGIPEVWEGDSLGYQKWSNNIKHRLDSTNNEIDFYKLLEVIFSLEINEGYHQYYNYVDYSKSILYKKLLEAIFFSNINLATSMLENGEIIFYPKGEERLDEELVNYVLSFLNRESHDHFVDSLHSFQDHKHVKSVESLRRALEEYLRFLLKNQKGLKANIEEIQKFAKEKGTSAQFRNILNSVFSCLDDYFNENSKHNDGDISESDNEYLIYQTAVLMRYYSHLK